MNYGDARLQPVHGMVDPAGYLIAADQRLEELNARAGGALGQPLAVPQIARLARLAQRLGILVSRGVIAADPHGDIELWVRAEPTDLGVRLALTGWQSKSPWAAAAAIAPEREAAFIASEGDWLWETDAALRLTFVTPTAGPRYGFDPAAVLGQPLTRLFELGEDASGDLPLLGALALRQQFDGQIATMRASGRRVKLSASPRVDAGGVFAGLLGGTAAAEDDADTDDASEPLVPLSSSAMLPAIGGDDFARRLDRALRTPLDRIIANADSIHARSDGPIRQDYVDYAADISTAARHLVDLVDDLTDLHFIERPGFTAAAEPIDLADVARRAGGLLQVRAGEQGVRIDRPAADETLPALGEFRRALQVMVNLVGNAVRYSPPDAMVWLRTEIDGSDAVVIVADQGKGIGVEDQARIFEKFERVDPREPGGSGLGLYISRRLARAMGGDVTVDSAPGQGARFLFRLPLRQDAGVTE